MQTDIEIAQSVEIKPITEIATAAGLQANEIEPYGYDKAKLIWIHLSCVSKNWVS